MSELEQTKSIAINSLKHLCARCHDGLEHNCRVAGLINQIQAISGVPVIVNSELRHLVFK